MANIATAVGWENSHTGSFINGLEPTLSQPAGPALDTGPDEVEVNQVIIIHC